MGIDPGQFLAFVQETQLDEWTYLKSFLGSTTEKTLLDDLCTALNSEYQGCLNVLRHGFKCQGKLIRAAYFAPASGMNPDIVKKYEATRLTVTRQLVYSTKHKNTIDLVLSLNGIPVITAELKNPMTGQMFRMR